MRKVRSTWRLIEDRIHYVCFFGTAKGGKAFRDITMPFVGYPQKLQWDGKHMALNAGGTIYQMQVSGSRGKIVGTTGLRGDTENQAKNACNRETLRLQRKDGSTPIILASEGRQSRVLTSAAEGGGYAYYTGRSITA